MTTWYKAEDTFSVDLKDGSSLLVTKGSPWPEGHEVVRLDAGRNLLFKPMEEDEPAEAEPKPKAASRRAAGKAPG